MGNTGGCQSLKSSCSNIPKEWQVGQGCKGHGLLSKADVAEPKLGMLTTQEASQSRGKFLRQGRATLFRKAANRDDGGLVSQRAIFPKLAFRLFFKGRGCGWLQQTSSCWNPLFLQLSTQVRSKCLCKRPETNVILCSANCYLL